MAIDDHGGALGATFSMRCVVGPVPGPDRLVEILYEAGPLVK